MDAKVKKKPAPALEVKDTPFNKLVPYERNITYYDKYVEQHEVVYKEKYKDILESLPTIIDPTCRIGIEVEVENVRTYEDHALFCWVYHQDDSLRNNGREFVTYPIMGQTIPLALHTLFDQILPTEYDFSKRTSVHVHMNVRNMTPEQVASFVCLFIVFEKILYKFVGHDRHKNIFCVPLQQTQIINHLVQGMENAFREISWYKYAGMNLLPIQTFGSIEFRQLHGTDDIPLICTWINLLQRMRLYAVGNKLTSLLDEITNLNTNSQYDFFVSKVFREQALILPLETLAEDMEPGVICVKECTLNNNFHKAVLEKVSESSDMLARLYEHAIKLSEKKGSKVKQASSYDELVRRHTAMFTIPEGVQVQEQEPPRYIATSFTRDTGGLRPQMPRPVRTDYLIQDSILDTWQQGTVTGIDYGTTTVPADELVERTR